MNTPHENMTSGVAAAEQSAQIEVQYQQTLSGRIEQRRAALVLSTIFAACSLAAFIVSSGYPVSAARAPQAVSLATLVVSIVNIFREIKAIKEICRDQPSKLTLLVNDLLGSTIKKTTSVLAAAYILAFKPLGFIVATAMFTSTMAYVLGLRKWYNIVLMGPIAAIILYSLFAEVFGLRLPRF